VLGENEEEINRLSFIKYHLFAGIISGPFHFYARTKDGGNEMQEAKFGHVVLPEDSATFIVGVDKS